MFSFIRISVKYRTIFYGGVTNCRFEIGGIVMGNNIIKDTGWLSWFGEYARKIAREAEQKLADDLKAKEAAVQQQQAEQKQKLDAQLKAIDDARQQAQAEAEAREFNIRIQDVTARMEQLTRELKQKRAEAHEHPAPRIGIDEDAPHTDEQDEALKAMGETLRDVKFDQKRQAVIDRILEPKEGVGKTKGLLRRVASSPCFNTQLNRGGVDADDEETKFDELTVETKGLSQTFYTPRPFQKKS